MPIFLVKLDGGQEQSDRTCELTVDAKDADAAKAFAEEHNPGLKATDAKKHDNK